MMVMFMMDSLFQKDALSMDIRWLNANSKCQQIHRVLDPQEADESFKIRQPQITSMIFNIFREIFGT